MKNTKITYWIITGLFGAFMLFSAIPDVILMSDAVTFMSHIGYPNYFTQFIGVAKVLGVIALLIPGFPKIKEWAYAGLAFDLIGAVYSLIYVDGFKPGILFLLLPITFLFVSYYLWHKKTQS